MAVADTIASVPGLPAGLRLWTSFILYDAARSSTFWAAFERLATHFLFDAHDCDLKAQCDSILAEAPEGADLDGAVTPEGDLPVWRVRQRLQMYLAYSSICKVQKSDRMDAAREHWKAMKFMGSEKADQEPIWTNAVQTATRTNNSGRHIVKVSATPSPPWEGAIERPRIRGYSQ